jgi:hypothetical protein
MHHGTALPSAKSGRVHSTLVKSIRFGKYGMPKDIEYTAKRYSMAFQRPNTIRQTRRVGALLLLLLPPPCLGTGIHFGTAVAPTRHFTWPVQARGMPQTDHGMPPNPKPTMVCLPRIHHHETCWHLDILPSWRQFKNVFG